MVFNPQTGQFNNKSISEEEIDLLSFELALDQKKQRLKDAANNF